MFPASNLFRFSLFAILAILVVGSPLAAVEPADSDRIDVIFLGDNGPHQPARRASELLPALADRGIDAQYTDDVAGTLTPERLQQVDGLILYANIDEISDSQANALLEFVEEGGGFIPLHCASYCFRNNDSIVKLIGAQFQRHGTGTFSVKPTDAAAQHPIMSGYNSFESWDETYVHTKHNTANRTVLEYRVEGNEREPWTWVRTQGKGRVFYTAWGHDARTFSQPGFHNLVERGVRWACGKDPSEVASFAGVKPEPLSEIRMTAPRTDVKAFEYVDVGPKIPNYVDSARWGEQENPRNLMQVPLDPDESMKHYVVPEGFRLSLFATEPDIGGKPICMNWDEQGRLWIAETLDYPNEKKLDGQGRDRIRICEDTDGDGRADKFTIFADKLSIPSSIAFAYGGIVVHQAPDTLFLKDEDGDDVADTREVLFTGWSTEDTHAGPSNLNYGHDNWFYGMVGYAGFKGIIAGKERSFRTGFYRFKVERVDNRVAVTEFEFLRNTNNNSWGVGISEEGLLFGSTANRNPSEFMPIANRYYERVRGWSSTVLTGIADTHLFHPVTDKVRQVDHHGGYTAAAGHAIYTARAYPQAYWNRAAFVAGPTGHLVGTFALKRKGAGFVSSSPGNLLASDDEWAAPIMAEVGPDGNVWVIDWYNYIVQHNPTPIGFEKGPGNAYVTDLRDKKHARIYRVVYDRDSDSTDSTEPTSLDGESTSDLIVALSSTNMFWRRHAQRLLVEAGKADIVPRLFELVSHKKIDAIGLDVGAIHALRTLQGLGQLESKEARRVLTEALKHPSTGVVRTAIEVLPRNEAGRDSLLESDAFDSSDAQVRLSALLALSEMPPSAEGNRVVFEALARPGDSNDRWIHDAAISAAATHGELFLTRACQETTPFDEGLPAAVTIVAEHVARSSNIEAVAHLVGPLSRSDPKIATAIVAGLVKGWPKSTTVPLDAESEIALATLFEKLSADSQGQLVRLGTIWGSEKLAEKAELLAAELLRIAVDETIDGQERIDAATQLMELLPNNKRVAGQLLEAVSPRTSPAVAVGMVGALRRSRAAGVGEAILESMSRMTPTARSEAIRVLLSRPETTTALLVALTKGQLTLEELTLEQQQSLIAHPSQKILRLARKFLAGSGGLPNPDRQKVLTSMMHVTKRSGDADRGKAIFVKNCANCHTHRGEGKSVGPDLTGMAVHPKAELLTHILDPSRSVEGNYRSYSVLTIDGIVINGMLASETETTMEIFDSQGKKQVVLREEIEQLVASKKSVMPEGFEKQIDGPGFTDLLEFLTAKGRFLPLPLGKAATAVSTRGLFHQGDDGPDRLVFADWTPKMVGDVPFQLIDPQGKRVANIVLLNGPRGSLPPKMPKSVRIPCHTRASAIHLLGGVSGWGFPAHSPKSVSMLVRLHLADGSVEDHRLVNGVHFADYIRRVDVPGSEFAMSVGGQQLRHVVVEPSSTQVIDEIELIKGDDPTAPIVVAITVEGPKELATRSVDQ